MMYIHDVLPENMFMIRRTSGDYTNPSQPCEEAYKARVLRIECRTLDDGEALPDEWVNSGINHRIEGNVAKRDMEYVVRWIAEVLDIAAFVRKYGVCVVGFNYGQLEIKIVDDRRE